MVYLSVNFDKLLFQEKKNKKVRKSAVSGEKLAFIRESDGEPESPGQC